MEKLIRESRKQKHRLLNKKKRHKRKKHDDNNNDGYSYSLAGGEGIF